MRQLLFQIATLMMVAGPATAGANPLSCPGFVDGKALPLDADRFYSDRALSIVRAGLANNIAMVKSLVAPSAQFELWRGDYTTSSRLRGTQGALNMIQDLKPTHYQTAILRSGLISVTPSQCMWNVTVLFRTERPDEGVTMKFEFADGLLVDAVGRQVVLAEGDIR